MTLESPTRPSFPVFVLAKDSGEIAKYDTIEAMERSLEKIDVENDEYLAWDHLGNRVGLVVQRQTWLAVGTALEGSRAELTERLRMYAARVGLSADRIARLSDEPLAMYAEISTSVQPRGGLRSFMLWASALLKRAGWR